MKFWLRLSLLLMVLAPSVQAIEVAVKARSYRWECGYAATSEADFQISYENKSLPWGTTITLLSGWNGLDVEMGYSPTHIEWGNSTQTAMLASAPYTWAAVVSGPLSQHFDTHVYRRLGFVFRINLPDGRFFYERGGSGNLGYFLTAPMGQGPCLDSGEDLPPFTPIEFTTVNKSN